jgi:hypothetical protein
MKNKINFKYLSAGLLAVLMVFGIKASALTVDVNGSAEVGVAKSNSSASATGTVKMESGEQNTRGANSNAVSAQATSSTRGSTERSAVASFVQSLLSVANRDGGIGPEVRLVAQEQASTSEKVKTDMDNLSGESKIKVFLFGPNYKNLGDLRSSIVTTQNNIDRLKKVQTKATSASVKADLEVQIKALEDVASSTEAFVEANESKLSILGWFVKIFVK